MHTGVLIIKSCLYNKLLGKTKGPLTLDTPGVTRDVHFDFLKDDEFKLTDDCLLVDTGGSIVDKESPEHQNSHPKI